MEGVCLYEGGRVFRFEDLMKGGEWREENTAQSKGSQLPQTIYKSGCSASQVVIDNTTWHFFAISGNPKLGSHCVHNVVQAL
jgi:hypothetical protein